MDNFQFQRIGFCVRKSRGHLNIAAGEFHSRSIQQLKAIWSRLCIYPDTSASGIPVIDILLSSSSTDFNGLAGDVLELRRPFCHPYPAFIIGGLDGMTTDILGFLEFLNSVEHKYPVEIFTIERGDLRLQISSLELQYTLQEHVNKMPQAPTLLPKSGTSLPSALASPLSALTSPPLTPMSFDNARLGPLLRDPNANTAASQTTTDNDLIMGREAGLGGMSVDLGASMLGVGCLDRTPVQLLIMEWELASWGKSL